jgi:hypothetical protein
MERRKKERLEGGRGPKRLAFSKTESRRSERAAGLQCRPFPGWPGHNGPGIGRGRKEKGLKIKEIKKREIKKKRKNIRRNKKNCRVTLGKLCLCPVTPTVLLPSQSPPLCLFLFDIPYPNLLSAPHAPPPIHRFAPRRFRRGPDLDPAEGFDPAGDVSAFN